MLLESDSKLENFGTECAEGRLILCSMLLESGSTLDNFLVSESVEGSSIIVCKRKKEKLILSCTYASLKAGGFPA